MSTKRKTKRAAAAKAATSKLSASTGSAAADFDISTLPFSFSSEWTDSWEHVTEKKVTPSSSEDKS